VYDPVPPLLVGLYQPEIIQPAIKMTTNGQRTVIRVRVVVHNTGAYSPTSLMSHNHWYILLLLSDSESVRINMTTEPGYITGQLVITDHNYILSNNAIRSFDFDVNPAYTITVDHFISLIFEYKRNFYNFSGGGSGCSYWV
jgi:hypothetical protein